MEEAISRQGRGRSREGGTCGFSLDREGLAMWKILRTGNVCTRRRKTTDMTDTVGRAERGDCTEGVILKPKAAAQKAGLKRAGLPWTLEPDWGWSRVKGAWLLLPILRACPDSLT